MLSLSSNLHASHPPSGSEPLPHALWPPPFPSSSSSSCADTATLHSTLLPALLCPAPFAAPLVSLRTHIMAPGLPAAPAPPRPCRAMELRYSADASTPSASSDRRNVA
eukprot:1033982-Rhodomonas_salina.5